MLYFPLYNRVTQKENSLTQTQIIKKLAELRDLAVLKISLVDAGANRKELIYKAGYDKVDKQILIKKVDEEKRLIYCIVYSPNEEDAHGHFATADTIEKACHKFSEMSKMHSVDEQHDMNDLDDVFVAESWIIKEGDSMFPGETGAWAVCIKINNDEIWKKVKDGVLKGVSMYGFAKVIEKNKSKLSKLLKLKDKIIEAFDDLSDKDYAEEMNELEKCQQLVKDFNESYKKNTLYNVVNAMCDAMWSTLYGWDGTDTGATDSDKINGLIESANQFKAKLTEIENANEVAKEFAKAGKVLSEANLTKLQTAIDNLQSIHDAASGEEVKKQSLLEKIKPKESEMTAEEIQKAIDDKVKPVIEKNEELANKNTELADELKKANDEIAELKKRVPGSKQEENPSVKKEVKKGMFVNVPVTEE